MNATELKAAHAVEDVRLAAMDSPTGMAADTTTYVRIVLLAVARPMASVVIAIDRPEWERVNKG